MAADGAGGFVTARLPRHLKLPTPPGEELSEVLYNTVRDFLVSNMGAALIGLLPFCLNATSKLSAKRKSLAVSNFRGLVLG